MKQGECSIYFDNKVDRNLSDRIRDSWFAELACDKSFQGIHDWHMGRDRSFLVKDLEGLRIKVTHHEWGIEYIFSFIGGIATGVLTNYLYDYLKEQIRRFKQKSVDILPDAGITVTVTIDLNSENGPIEIGKIEAGSVKMSKSKAQFKVLLAKLPELQSPVEDSQRRGFLDKKREKKAGQKHRDRITRR